MEFNRHCMQAAGDLYLCPIISRQLDDVTIDVHTQLDYLVIQQYLLWTPKQQTNHFKNFWHSTNQLCTSIQMQKKPKRFTPHFSSFAAGAN